MAARANFFCDAPSQVLRCAVCFRDCFRHRHLLLGRGERRGQGRTESKTEHERLRELYCTSQWAETNEKVDAWIFGQATRAIDGDPELDQRWPEEDRFDLAYKKYPSVFKSVTSMLEGMRLKVYVDEPESALVATIEKPTMRSQLPASVVDRLPWARAVFLQHASTFPHNPGNGRGSLHFWLSNSPHLDFLQGRPLASVRKKADRASLLVDGVCRYAARWLVLTRH